MSQEKVYRPGLPEIPKRMRSLPIERGYPVPWFAPKVGDHYEFRAAEAGKFWRALEEERCWTCGDRLGQYMVFVIGPMCAVNRTTAEPPNHKDCAEFSVKACPFLSQQEGERREDGMPDSVQPPPGYMIKRQPGVVLLWATKEYKTFGDGKGGTLIEVGDPEWVSWWRQGRTALRSEIHASMAEGLPLLFGMAQAGGYGDIVQFCRQVERANALIR